jgi:small subunit ribosomal protein S6
MLHCPVFLPCPRAAHPERRLLGGADSDRGKEVLGTLATAYEILLMLDPELPEERQDEIIARTRELVEKAGGTWSNHEPWGRRRLAYEIAHKGEGVYHLLTFECDAEVLDEASRILKITDGVMRHMAVRRVAGSRPGAPPPYEEPGRQDDAVGAGSYAGANTRSRPEQEEE